MPMRAFTRHRAEVFRGCLELQGQHVFLLEPAKLITSNEVAEVTRGHSKLYTENIEEIDGSRQGQKGGRDLSLSTYIAFQLGGTYAVPILDVIEIIDTNHAIVSSPGSAQLVLGIINLRGEAIVIFDTPKVYKLDESAYENGRIVIFNSDEGKFGLLVSALDSIVKIRQDQRLETPGMLTNAEGKIMADVQEVVTYSGDDGQVQSLAILDKTEIFASIKKRRA